MFVLIIKITCLSTLHMNLNILCQSRPWQIIVDKIFIRWQHLRFGLTNIAAIGIYHLKTIKYLQLIILYRFFIDL